MHSSHEHNVGISDKPHRRVCPKTGRPLSRQIAPSWPFWALPIVGLVSLVWFLLRVIPRPSRALYPCQQVAMPLASGFVAWILGAAGSVLAFRKAGRLWRRSRWALALACLAVAVGLGVAVIHNLPQQRLSAAEVQGQSPIGTGKGIHPGRVVWVHDPDATDWEGPGNGHLWEPAHTDRQVCDEMMSKAVRALAGEMTDADAWNAIFRYHNRMRGKGDVGYQPGEKITIKVNFVGMIRTTDAVNRQTYNLQSWQDYMNTSPQMIAALLKQLTTTVGVRQGNITVGDTLAHFGNEYYDILHTEFPDVCYLDCSERAGRVQTEMSGVPFYWSCRPNATHRDYVPKSYAEAEYFVNMANLKAHPLAGVTLCAKNHFGSLIRTPPERGYYDMHPTVSSKGTAEYRDLVDLMGHAHLGGKTVLYLIDGLYGGMHFRERVPRRFAAEPFDNDWSNSLFASQDPVAIDSVGLDFVQLLIPEYARTPGADDYLHEAALANDPPSGTFYDPDHAKPTVQLASLGAHEHWNNATDRKYSRNLGRNEGIELIAVIDGDEPPAATGIIAPGAKVTLLAEGFSFTEGPAPDAEGNVYFTDQPNDRICKWSVSGKLTDFMKPCGRSNGLFFDPQGNLWACADMNNQLWKIEPSGKVTVVIKDFNGKLLNGPNDLWMAPDGGIYFTDPLYRRDYWTRDPAMQQDGQHVYYLSPDRQTLVRVAEDLRQPNGIIGTPDGKLLYVADIGARRTYRYKINEDATLSDKTLFCEMGSDGMTIDSEGNVYLTGRGVTVFNPQGEQIEQIPINERWTANVCFGGKDRRTLFVTASDSLYALQMRVKGAY